MVRYNAVSALRNIDLESPMALRRVMTALSWGKQTHLPKFISAHLKVCQSPQTAQNIAH